jgi:hypothetical protein
MYFDTSLKTSRRDQSGVCSTQTAAGSDTAEGTQNNTVLVQMEEEERAIRAMPFVTTLSFVRAVKGKAEGWRVTLTCFAFREYNSCEKKQEASVHISGERPTLLACLQELRKRLEEHHGLRVKLWQPLSRPSVRQGVLVMSSLMNE